MELEPEPEPKLNNFGSATLFLFPICRGIVSVMHKGRRVFLAPNLGWKGYDPSW